MMFLNKMLIVFLERTAPASSIAKPACIQKTKKPQIRIQMASAFPLSALIAL